MPVQTFFSHIEFDIPNNIKDFLEVVRLENILVCMLHNCKVRNMGKFVERVEKATTDLGIRSDKAENPILKERSKIVDLLVKAIQASNMDVDELMIKLNTSHAEYEEQIKNGGFSLIEILEITEDLRERLLKNKG